MTMTQVQFLPPAGQTAGGQAVAAPPGLEGLFAQLINAAQPVDDTEAANIAQTLPPELGRTLPSDPGALKDLLNRVKQALSKGSNDEALAMLSTVKVDTSAIVADASTQQNLPTAAPAVSVRSQMVTFQPREVESLLQHENLILQGLGFENIDLTQGADLEALTQAYMQAGLSPQEAAVRADVVSRMSEHLVAAPQQPMTTPLPTGIAAPAPKDVSPLPINRTDFMAAIQAAAQAMAPESEDVVTQILSLDSFEGIDEKGEPITKKVDVPIIQSMPVTNPQPTASTVAAEAKATTEALADLALGGKATGMQTRTAQSALEASSQTTEGKIVDNALGQQPSTHLLAAVEHSDTTNGVATQSGAAVSVAATYSQNDSSYSDADQRGHTTVEEATRINHEASAATFDRFLNQKLETQVPVAATYNNHGKIPTPGEQVSVSVRQLAEAGGGEVRIKLMPEELGRVDIRLEIHNSQVRGVVMVERPEVLGDLARDLKHLQQALAATGLTMADNALSFQMQNHGGSQDDGRGRNGSAPLGGVKEMAANDDGTTFLPTGPWRDVTKLVDVNI